MKTDKKKFYTLKTTDIPIRSLKFWVKEFKMRLKRTRTVTKISYGMILTIFSLLLNICVKKNIISTGIKKICELKWNSRNKEYFKYIKTYQYLFWIQKELRAVKSVLQESDLNEMQYFL